MRWYYPAGIIFALLLGLGLGRMIAPRYHAPADSSEARLKARAVELYQAGRTFDALKMRQLFTPARQLAESKYLLKEAENQRRYWEDLKPEEQEEQKASAAKITPDCIEVELYTGEGWGWAVTTGTAPLLVAGREIPQQFDRTVWVLAHGDWWVYDRSLEELSAYGNPPDEIIKILQMPRLQAIPSAAPSAPPATDAPVPDAKAAPAEPPQGEPGA